MTVPRIDAHDCELVGHVVVLRVLRDPLGNRRDAILAPGNIALLAGLGGSPGHEDTHTDGSCQQ